MNRRTLLYAAVAALVVGRLPSDDADHSAIGAGLADISALFPSLAAAAKLGRQYLREAGADKSREVLLEELGLAPAGRHRADTLTAIRERRHADFFAGALVTIDGWVLARSEAAACALLALSWRNPS